MARETIHIDYFKHPSSCMPEQQSNILIRVCYFLHMSCYRSFILRDLWQAKIIDHHVYADWRAIGVLPSAQQM